MRHLLGRSEVSKSVKYKKLTQHDPKPKFIYGSHVQSCIYKVLHLLSKYAMLSIYAPLKNYVSQTLNTYHPVNVNYNYVS